MVNWQSSKQMKFYIYANQTCSIITVFKMVYSQILPGLRFSSHVLTVLYPSLLSHKSIGYTHHFKFSMNFMFSANLLINFSIFILPCNNTTYYLSISWIYSILFTPKNLVMISMLKFSTELVYYWFYFTWILIKSFKYSLSNEFHHEVHFNITSNFLWPPISYSLNNRNSILYVNQSTF